MDTSPKHETYQDDRSANRSGGFEAGWDKDQQPSALMQRLTDVAKRWPIPTLAGALVAGFLAGRITSRKG